MKDEKLTPLMYCHLAMMLILAVMSLAVAVILMKAVLPGSDAGSNAWRPSMLSSVFIHLTDMAALCCGILYLVKGYRKNAALYYKLFLLLVAASCVFNAITMRNMMYSSVTDDVGSNVIYIARILYMTVKIILLLILAIFSDTGKRNTWVIFSILLISDVVFSVPAAIPPGYDGLTAVAVFSKLFLDGTIGLAIRGKYADKDSRGTN